MCAGLALATPSAAPAQDYPAKPIRTIVSVSAGGIGDLFMRVLGEELHKRWGQPVVVENRPGGSMNIGARACAESPPDGYTICMLPGEPLIYGKHLYKALPFDPERDFEPITTLFLLTQVLAVNASLSVNSLDELAALSKTRPGTLSYTVPGLSLALFMEDYKRRTGADLVRVPFKGGGDAVNGLLSGATPVAFFGLGNVIEYLRGGQVKGLVVDGEQRSPLFAQIPTLHEIGYRGDHTPGFFGLVAPAGTSQAVIGKIRDEVARIASEPAFMDRHIVQRGLQPVLNRPDEFSALLRKNREAAARIVKASNVQPQ